MSKHYTNSTKANAVTYQKSKKQGFIPTSKKKKWDKTHTVVLILILLWSIGSILGTISFIKTCKNNTSSNVAYADDTIIQDTYDFTFNTVQLPLTVQGNYNIANTSETSISISLPTHYFTLSLHFTYNGFDGSTSYCNWYTDGLWLNDGGSIVGLTPITTNATRLSDTSSYFDIGYGTFTQYTSNNPSYSVINYYLLSNTVGGNGFNFDGTFNMLRLANYLFPDNVFNRITYSNFPITVEMSVPRFNSTNFNRVVTTLEPYNSTKTKFSYTYYNDLDEYFTIWCYSSINTSWLSNTNDIYFSYTRYTTNLFSDNEIYQTGFNEGYYEGYDKGSSDGYTDGKNAGINIGYNEGYSRGKIDGVASANDYTFLSLLSSVIDAPIQAVSGMLNFTLLGVRMDDLFYAILTVCLFIAVVKIVLKAVN